MDTDSEAASSRAGSETDVETESEAVSPTGVEYEAGTEIESDTDPIAVITPQRRGCKWTGGDDARLLSGYRRQISTPRIAAILGRTPRAVRDRLAKLRQPNTPAPTSATVNLLPTQRLEIYAFGTGECAELGLGPEVKARVVRRPRLNVHLHHEKVGIVAIAAGGMHGLALSHEGRVYSWGVNDQSALGRGTQYTPLGGDGDSGSDSDSDSDVPLNALESTPMPITSFPEGTVITNIAAGDSISIAVTNTGRVYTWGTFRSSEGILGFNEDIHVQPVPKLLDTPQDVVQVAAGTNHALALTKRGEVYTWGNGEHGELGRRIVPRARLTQLNPTRVITEGVTSVAAGSYHSFAIDRDGKVWSWGLNQYAQCGIDDNDGIRFPTLVGSLTDYRIKQISAGEHHTAALTDGGQLLVWGRDDDGQLGLGLVKSSAADVVSTRSVHKLHVAPGTSFTSIACGTHHNIAISTEGQAFTWGSDVGYQTGQGPHNQRGEIIDVPTQIENKATIGVRLVSAAAGGQFSIIAGVPAMRPTDGAVPDNHAIAGSRA
ncbi:hypothetical protein C7212DRAFT_277797 [Tuber magnatum]|uniref:RCC1-like domain-containing protein n=1 Tax=Tuber magnatum TaxID=42249 RepID=A0A317SUY4_9PEZI|nr:hypothetical protein C7212DRAFT_277797 [Tuber magnatum]